MFGQEGTVMQAPDRGTEVMFQSILLATDFSPSSQSALLYSLAIARRYHARIFLAHVVNPPAMSVFGQEAAQRAVNDAWREAHTEMTNQLIAGRLEGIENHVVVTQGEVWEELSKLVRKFKVDLLVTGTRGRTGVWKMLMGSTAEKIFQNSQVPVLTIGPRAARGVPPEVGPRRILYATGFATQSLYAGRYAFSIARQQQASVALLTVVRDAEDAPAEERARMAQESKERLISLIPRDASLTPEPEIIVSFGNAAQAILETSEQWKPDLIVLGLRRREEPGRRPTWATAYQVVANAACPVLTARAPEGT